jgi:hypothetical protein
MGGGGVGVVYFPTFDSGLFVVVVAFGCLFLLLVDGAFVCTPFL